MEWMRTACRLSALAVAAVVALAAATPLEALACDRVAPCPMMKAAKAGGGTPCHAGDGATTGMAMPMDCCSNEPAAPVAPTVPTLAPAMAAAPFAAAPVVVLAALPKVESTRDERSGQALFELHAVWRI